MTYLNDIFCLIGEHRRKLPGLFLMFLAGAGLDLVGLSIIGPYIGLISSPGSELARSINAQLAPQLPTGIQPIIALGWLLLCVFVIRLVALLYVNFRLFNLASQVDASLRITLLRRYQALPYSQWLLRNTSEYLAAINQQVAGFVFGIIINGLRAASDCVAALAILGFLLYTDWRAFLVIVAIFSLFAFFYDRVFKVRLTRYGTRQRELSIAMNTGVRHAMEGLKELRVLGAEENFNQRLAKHAIEYSRIQARFNTIFNVPRYLAEFAVISFIVVMVSATQWLLGDTTHLSSLFGVFGLGAFRLMPAANSLMAFMTQARFQRNIVEHLAGDYRDLSPGSVPSHTERTTGWAPFLSLTARDVHFRYPQSSEKAISGVSLTIEKGEAVAFIGSSGSGKTTLIDILLGLLEPQQGAILVNDHPLMANRRRLLDHVAYLPQHVFLIDDTLRANVAIGVPDDSIDDQLVRRALSQAQLEDLVQRLPEGLDTIVGDRGLRLSGGQRQRVALARAFYHRKDIIIMDEATSALDHETERDIVQEINLLKGKTTLIVIAHRLTTVQQCDRIYRLDDGKLTQTGSFNEVVARAVP